MNVIHLTKKIYNGLFFSLNGMALMGNILSGFITSYLMRRIERNGLRYFSEGFEPVPRNK